MSLAALQDTVHDYICKNSLTEYLNVPKTTVEANARDGYENEDGDEKMAALDETPRLMMLGHPHRVWIGNERTEQVASRRKIIRSQNPQKASWI